jgi:hypothetical protein
MYKHDYPTSLISFFSSTFPVISLNRSFCDVAVVRKHSHLLLFLL